MTSPFEEAEAPPSTTFLTPTNHIGTTAVFVARRVAYGEQKPWGECKDTLYADVYLIQGEGAGAEFINTGITNSKLVAQMANSIGKAVLGTFAYGEGKAGKKPVILGPTKPEHTSAAALWAQANASKLERSKAAARQTAEQPQPAAAGGWGTPPPPPVTAPAVPPF